MNDLPIFIVGALLGAGIAAWLGFVDNDHVRLELSQALLARDMERLRADLEREDNKILRELLRLRDCQIVLYQQKLEEVAGERDPADDWKFPREEEGQ